MDPVVPATLFSVLDRLATRMGPVRIADLESTRRFSNRRFAEIGRVIEGLGLAQRVGQTLVPTGALGPFVSYWEQGDLDGISGFFQRYVPYDAFRGYLQAERCIALPRKGERGARRRMGKELRSGGTGLTFVAIDTFKWWGMAVGEVYLSPFGEREIYWGGERPALDEFEAILQVEYAEIRPLDGFANVGRLADRVCRQLCISFPCFERLFLGLWQRRRFATGTSLQRGHRGRGAIQILRPRSEAKRRGLPVEWTAKRFVEDGLVIHGRSVKVVKLRPGP